MKPTMCTLLLGIFISNSLHVWGNYVPIIRRTYCIYATLVFFTLYGWLSGLLVEMRLVSSQTADCHPYKVISAGGDEISLIPTSRPDSHPYRVKSTSVA